MVQLFENGWTHLFWVIEQLNLVILLITRIKAMFREAIYAHEKLTVTLRYLATWRIMKMICLKIDLCFIILFELMDDATVDGVLAPSLSTGDSLSASRLSTCDTIWKHTILIYRYVIIKN